MDPTNFYTAAFAGKHRVVKDTLAAAASAGELDLNAAALQVMHGQMLRAGAKGRIECLRLLLEAGADPNTIDQTEGPGKGASLLRYAVGYENVELVKLLIRAGADLARKDQQGYTIFDVAGALGNAEIRAVLAEAGAVGSKFTTVWQAAYYGDVVQLRALLAAGAELYNEGRSPLNLAAMNGHVEVCTILLEAGQDVEGTDQDQFTPLMTAASEGHVDVVRLLLEHGADPKVKRGVNTLLKAARNAINVSRERKQALLALLENAGAKIDPAFTAVKTLASASEQPGFLETARHVAGLLGCEPRPWKKRKGVYQFPRFHDAALPQAQADARAAGFCLVRTGVATNLQESALLFPSRDKYVVVAACGTNTNMGGGDAHDIVVWLRAMDAENPFELTECGHDRVAGAFSGPVVNALPLAERMLRFCPELSGPAAELAEELEQSRRFGFWWD